MALYCGHARGSSQRKLLLGEVEFKEKIMKRKVAAEAAQVWRIQV